MQSREERLAKKKIYNARINADPAYRSKVNAKAAEYRARPEVIKRMEKWKRENKAWYDDYIIRTKDRRKAKKIEKNYGISKEQYDAMWSSQGGICPICKGQLGKAHTDHDHATGKVRGILCRNCNLLLGYAKDNIETLESAIKYLLCQN